MTSSLVEELNQESLMQPKNYLRLRVFRVCRYALLRLRRVVRVARVARVVQWDLLVQFEGLEASFLKGDHTICSP